MSKLLTNTNDLQKVLEALQGKAAGSNIPSTSTNEVNFYDYDGTLLHSYTVEEIQSMNELPELPTRKGLLCQGWNYDLDTIKSHNRKLNVGATYITDDGTTRIYIHLEEGRTSPMLGVCPNGTVTVDWGDGTPNDTLTGTSNSTVKWTPNHEYAESGNYVITLTVNGTMGFYGSNMANQYSGILRHNSSADLRNYVYQSSVYKIEIGDSVTSIGSNAFYSCYSLASITIPNTVTSIGDDAFHNCYSLASITIPDSVTSIGNYAFSYCYSLASITISDSVTSIGSSAFYNCYSLASITIPDSVTSIGDYAFYNCYSIKYYDFTNHTYIPVLSNINAFTSIAVDCEIRVPMSLYDEWITATNWSTYANYIKAI